MKLNKVAIVSKFGSKISEDAAKKVAKKLLSKKIRVYTIAPVDVDGEKQVESLDDLSKIKLGILSILIYHHIMIIKKIKILSIYIPIFTQNIIRI